MAVRVIMSVMNMVIMTVAVIMPMLMSVAMRMTMMRVTTHCQHAKEIDAQSYSTNQKKLISVHFRWIQKALNAFEYDEY
jgi:uncharacterized membrane protein